jgi:AraC-like DNA-binding protein
VVEITEIDDPAIANLTAGCFDQDVVQLETTRLRARQVIVRLDLGILIYYSTNVRVRTRPKLTGDLVGYVTFGPTATGTVNGLQVSSDLVVATPPSSGLDIVAEPGYESMAFLLHPQDAGQHLDPLDGDGTNCRSRHVEMSRAGSGLAGALFAWGKQLVNTAAEQPQRFSPGTEHRAAAQAELMQMLATTLSSTRKLEPQRCERTLQVQSIIVRSAERYAMTHSDERLYVTDLCRAAGVSERTLEYAFQAVMGMSPTAYLTRTRLHRVHQALLLAPPRSTTVTVEALNWGFGHFGEFSKAYKDCFDERPSDTLKRTHEAWNRPYLGAAASRAAGTTGFMHA